LNVGVLLHTAQYGSGHVARVTRIIEKRTSRKRERLVTRCILDAQRGKQPTGGLPRVYQLGKTGESYSIFQEFVAGVGSARLRDPDVIPAMSRAFRQLNKVSLPGLEMRDKASIFDARAAGIMSDVQLAGVPDDHVNHLKILIKHARPAIMALPVSLCHRDGGFGNMAHDDATGVVRLIDFGLIDYDFAASDLLHVFYSRHEHGFDTELAVRTYRGESDLSAEALFTSATLAAIQRCLVFITVKTRNGSAEALEPERRRLLKLMEELQELVLS